MKKIDVGQTMSVVANFGVLIGIVFLVIELRQNNQLRENEARFGMLQNEISVEMRQIENPDLVERRIRALNGE